MTDSVKSKVSSEEWQTRVDLAACYRAVAMYGWDDLIFTHISARFLLTFLLVFLGLTIIS